MLENIIIFIGGISIPLSVLGGFLIYALTFLDKRERENLFLTIKKRMEIERKIKKGEIKMYSKEEMREKLNKVRQELEDEENQRKNKKES